MFLNRMEKALFLFTLLCFSLPGYGQQKIEDFYLSNYEQDGKQDWEIVGREARVYDKHVDIDKMDAKYFSEKETLSIKSDKAKLIKGNSNVFLRDDVHVEGKDGIQLDTSSLNWIRKKNEINTEDWVEAKNQDMKIKAKGMQADTEFKKVDFEESVNVQLPNQGGKSPITVNCKGPLEIEYNDGRAVFYNEVVVEDNQGKLFCDKATLFFDPEGKKIDKIVAEGHVKIIQEENVTFAHKATYLGQEGKLVLEGSPRLIYIPQEGENSFFSK
jgi:LPS export ABC transporter protein LptC